MTIKEGYRKTKYNTKWFYHRFVYNYLCTDCILVLTHPDDGHSSDRNMLVRNNNM